MAEYTVNDDILHSPAAHDYFSGADRRVMIGLRAALELLGIPMPDYAKRKPMGRPPGQRVAEAYKADHPGERRPKPVSQDPLGAHRIAAAVAKAQARIDRTRALNDMNKNG